MFKFKYKSIVLTSLLTICGVLSSCGNSEEGGQLSMDSNPFASLLDTNYGTTLPEIVMNDPSFRDGAEKLGIPVRFMNVVGDRRLDLVMQISHDPGFSTRYHILENQGDRYVVWGDTTIFHFPETLDLIDKKLGAQNLYK
jgi:hypothetical protein